MKKPTLILTATFLYAMPIICMDDMNNPSNLNVDYAANYNTTPSTPEAQVNQDGTIIQSLNSKRHNDEDIKSRRKQQKCAKKPSKIKAQSSKRSHKDHEKNHKNRHAEENCSKKHSHRNMKKNSKFHDTVVQGRGSNM